MFHYHACQKEHGIAFAATGRSEIGSSFAVSFRPHMCLDIGKEFCSGEKLRVSADDFKLLMGLVGKIDEIFDHSQHPVLAEQAFDQGNKGVDALQILVRCLYFPPGVEEIIGAEQGTVFIIDPIADNHKSVVNKKARDIPLVAHGKLSIGIHDGRILIGGSLKLQNNEGQTIHIYDGIRDS